MKVLFFGTYDDVRNPRIRILREGFVAHGHRVQECVVPLGFSTDIRVLMLHRPWLATLMAARLAVAWLRLLIRSRRYRRPDVVVVGYMGHLDVHLARFRYRRASIVLDHLVSLAGTATDRRVRPGLFTRLLATVDARAVRAADLVAVDTEEHLADLPEEVQAGGVVVAVGAQENTFAMRTTPNAPPPLRVVFYGHFTPLQGAPTIGEAIALLHQRGRDDIRFTLIGRGQDFAATRCRAEAVPSTQWIGILDHDELVEVVAGHHVGLGIFGTTAKSMKVVPTKAYESAAAGLALVTADTPAQRRVLGDAALYVPAGDPVALADGLESLADDPRLLRHLADSASSLAEQFRPGAVVRPLLDRLEASRGPVPPRHP